MPAVDRTLLERVARSISHPESGVSAGARGSILKQAARFYGLRPIFDESTVPSGFDPQAAVLFEAVVEAAYLVATCDGVLDHDERVTFESIVVEACDNFVNLPQLDALLADFQEQLTEDGLDKRVAMVARAIRKREQQLEVLRIAALIAHMSDGVSVTEKRVLDQLAQGFDLPNEAVDHAISQADRALGGSG